ncbi:DsbA family oxidoreductase [Candidatus Solirubrobacter pratensis]|uniref:DsbA family oxidoreductase n=1 Tax=Candidatus Solirubrobacter pratensis TaxID=1298857 RepID=UPI0004029197|nr:DsbA family oxidoreductase [Candidatus Solirubrobacter pratensis]
MAFMIEIWSDVVCPWCYIGKRRMETALERFEHRGDVTLTWRSFELDPAAERDPEGAPAERLASKYGMSVEEAAARQAQIAALAAEEGLEYHMELTRGGNSFDAHRLIQLGRERGIQDAVKERLMRGYFTEGARIGDPETLVRLAVEAGLPEAEARAVVESDRYADAVREDEELARRIGINGVPFFVLGRRYGVSGAQPADVLVQALDQSWSALGEAA